ncbi:hypothetical protein [Ammoniphilus sp. 3BR4]|uniref:hypothetical protein n=1 Tax=Ammoniphilus sp. 3BR4 TaxID=3158265 RepID=UPI003466F54C
MNRLIESMVREKINNGLIEEKIFKDEYFADNKENFMALLEKLKGQISDEDFFDLEAHANGMWVFASEVAYREGLKDGLKLKGEG